MKDESGKVSQEGNEEKTTPFFGTGYEQSQFIREREAKKNMGKVAETESIPSEERMENPEEYEGFENEELDTDRGRKKASGVYSAEEVPEGKTRGEWASDEASRDKLSED